MTTGDANRDRDRETRRESDIVSDSPEVDLPEVSVDVTKVASKTPVVTTRETLAVQRDFVASVESPSIANEAQLGTRVDLSASDSQFSTSQWNAPAQATAGYSPDVSLLQPGRAHLSYRTQNQSSLMPSQTSAGYLNATHSTGQSVHRFNQQLQSTVTQNSAPTPMYSSMYSSPMLNPAAMPFQSQYSTCSWPPVNAAAVTHESSCDNQFSIGRGPRSQWQCISPMHGDSTNPFMAIVQKFIKHQILMFSRN